MMGPSLQGSHHLTGAFYAGNGWVAGGCWDDELDTHCGSFASIPCVKRTSKLWVFRKTYWREGFEGATAAKIKG